MKRIGLLIVCLAGLIFILPSSPAQDEKKKDPDKTDKKDEPKKDAAKDPEKKDDEKKKPDAPPAKEKKQIEKMPAHGAVFRTKVLSANGESKREFTVEKQEIDPKKVQDLTVWQAQQVQSLAQQQIQASTAKDFKSRITAQQNYQKAYATYSVELAKRQGTIYTAKPMDIRAHEDAKVRTMTLPVQFDDQGFQKKWTEKEKKALRGDTQLPGYPGDFDQLKSGQLVEIYLAKKPPPPKGEAKKKKGPDDDPAPEVKTTPEFILIVILQEGK